MSTFQQAVKSENQSSYTLRKIATHAQCFQHKNNIPFDI